MNTSFYVVENKSTTSVDLRMYGTISQWGEVRADRFYDQIKALEKDYSVINIRLHSPGGSIFEGIAMLSIMENSKAEINVYIDGLAASMASVFAMGAKRVFIAKTARIMIHQGSTGAWGSAGHLKRSAAMLESLNVDLAQIYADKTGKKKKWILDNWMKEGEDKWFTAAEALKEKLVDEIVAGKAEAPKKASAELTEMAAHYDSQLIVDTNQKHMTQAELAKKVGLAEDSSIEKIEAKVAELETTAQGDGGDGDGEEEPATEVNKQLQKAAMALATVKGLLSGDNKATVEAKIKADPAAAIDWMELVPAATAKVEKPTAPKGGELSKLLAGIKEKREPDSSGEKKYSQLTAEELKELEKTPEKLQAMIRAEYKDSDNPKT
jgi:ATP-dependent Clp endopeptidase proteolytic subunit ClpP